MGCIGAGSIPVTRIIRKRLKIKVFVEKSMVLSPFFLS
jgi:hypothetical protein